MESRPYMTGLFVLASTALFMSGCTGSLLPDRGIPPSSIAMSIPALPDEYGTPGVEWRIRWWDGQRVDTTTVRSEKNGTVRFDATIAESGAEVIVVSAVPTVVSAGVTLRSLGGWVRPPGREISLRLEAGVLADVVLDVCRDGLDPSLVNLERMQETIEREYRYGARRIDRTRLEEGLRSTEFRTYHIRPAEDAILEVRILDEESVDTGPEPGAPWFTDDQSAPVCPVVEAGAYLIWGFPITPGTVRHAWRSSPTGEIQRIALAMSVEGNGRYMIYTVTPDTGPP
ncbi:MAG: hypothetical protein ACLFR8_13535 [Alkalispirochaeta sp.]